MTKKILKKFRAEEGDSNDTIQENIARLKQFFPEAFSENGLDFTVLRQLLGDAKALSEGEEKFGLNWHGKKQARQMSLLPSHGTLRPCPQESVDQDKTQNLFIEGDNLEALKLLRRSYANKVKMIYIDPPYNTGKEFIYPDNFAEGLETYLDYTGQRGEDGWNVSKEEREKTGRKHSNWLSMMLPRLRLARDLLRDDGVIFISIDDNEQAHLKDICDDIFGEENFLGEIVWLKRNAQNDAANIQKNHDYILVYQKVAADISIANTVNQKIYKDKRGFYYEGAGLTTGAAGGTLNNRPNLGYSIYYNKETKDFIAVDDYDKEKARFSNIEKEVYTDNHELLGKGYVPIRPPKKASGLGRWTWQMEKFNVERDNILIKEAANGFSLTKKQYISSDKIEEIDKGYVVKIISRTPLKSYIDNISSSSGTKELIEIFENKIFDHPKSVALLKIILTAANAGEEQPPIILDFFAGSCTTADAVMQLNAEDGGKRRYIMVQLPEKITDEKSYYSFTL